MLCSFWSINKIVSLVRPDDNHETGNNRNQTMFEDKTSASAYGNEANYYLQVHHDYHKLIKSLSKCVDKQECYSICNSTRSTDVTNEIQSNDINASALHESNGNGGYLSACTDYQDLIKVSSANEHDEDLGNAREAGALYSELVQNTGACYCKPMKNINRNQTMLEDYATAYACGNEANYLQVHHDYRKLIKSPSKCVDKQECYSICNSTRPTDVTNEIQSNDINASALHESNGKGGYMSACIDYLEVSSANEHNEEMGNSREAGALYYEVVQNTDTNYETTKQASNSNYKKLSLPDQHSAELFSKAHLQQVGSIIYETGETLNTNFDELVQNTIYNERSQSTHLSTNSSTLAQQSQFMTTMPPSSPDSVSEGTMTHFLSLSRSVYGYIPI